jgi:branched-chain amino acid transport system ATP-binding protein
LESHLLEVEKINIFYGDAQAVWDVSLHVDNDAIVALIGANGAGKSTLLDTISGLLRPESGTIRFAGKSITDLLPEEIVTTGISHVCEGRRLFSSLTVLENLELGSFPTKFRPLLKESLDRVFTLFPVLKNRRHQAAGTLSGGEQQMLAIGRALMARPKLLMLDEPSLGLAPVIVELIFKIIQTLNREGATILLVEQNVRQTLEIVDYVYVLQTGRLMMEGRGNELLGDPDFQNNFLGMIL